MSLAISISIVIFRYTIMKRNRPSGAQPVSYTHLDVYKRQLLDTPLLGPTFLMVYNLIAFNVTFFDSALNSKQN